MLPRDVLEMFYEESCAKLVLEYRNADLNKRQKQTERCKRCERGETTHIPQESDSTSVLTGRSVREIEAMMENLNRSWALDSFHNHQSCRIWSVQETSEVAQGNVQGLE